MRPLSAHEDASMLPVVLRLLRPILRSFLRALPVVVSASLLCGSFSASAAEFVTLGGFAYHFERDLDLNEVNPGIGYEADYDKYPEKDLSWSVGVFKNSLRRAAFYGTIDWALWHPAEGWRAGATAGLSTGYHHSAVVPLLMPFIEWRIGKLGLQSYIIPTIKPYVDGAVVLQFKWQI
jgi:hypothetical protein